MDMDGNAYYIPYTIGHKCTGIPAWSLHRLIEMIDDPYEHYNWLGFIVEDDYDNMIQCIEFLIDECRFNKEYLED